jgi:hypothetical protein
MNLRQTIAGGAGCVALFSGTDPRTTSAETFVVEAPSTLACELSGTGNTTTGASILAMYEMAGTRVVLVEGHAPSDTAGREPVLSASEIGDRGRQHLAQLHLGADAEGKFIAVFVEDGEYVLEGSAVAALKAARARRPGAPVYVERVGLGYAFKLRT